MIDFLASLKSRNEYLFYFGMLCLLSAGLLFIKSRFSELQINEVNAWHKPVKFALSMGLFSLTMGWYTGYLTTYRHLNIYNWTVIIGLGFEVFYVAFQAARGQLSHYNTSSALYTSLTAAMALAAIAATLYTGYIGVLFCTGKFPELPDYYLWAIRLGIFIFVLFALEGAAIGANGSPGVGGTGGRALPFLNWSLTHGDLRIAHFIGMHALQVLPLLAYFVFKDVKPVLFTGLVYGVLALFCLLLALNGKSIFHSN